MIDWCNSDAVFKGPHSRVQIGNDSDELRSCSACCHGDGLTGFWFDFIPNIRWRQCGAGETEHLHTDIFALVCVIKEFYHCNLTLTLMFYKKLLQFNSQKNFRLLNLNKKDDQKLFFFHKSLIFWFTLIRNMVKYSNPVHFSKRHGVGLTH